MWIPTTRYSSHLRSMLVLYPGPGNSLTMFPRLLTSLCIRTVCSMCSMSSICIPFTIWPSTLEYRLVSLTSLVASPLCYFTSIYGRPQIYGPSINSRPRGLDSRAWCLLCVEFTMWSALCLRCCCMINSPLLPGGSILYCPLNSASNSALTFILFHFLDSQ